MSAECQSAGGGNNTTTRRPRDAAREAILAHIRDSPEGVPLNGRLGVVASVFGVDATEGAGGDYQFARRFVQSSDVVKTTRRDGLLWCEPTPEAYLTTSKHSTRKPTKPTDSDGVAMSNAEASCRRRRQFRSNAGRASVVGALGAKREAEAGVFTVFEDSFNRGEYVRVPFATRFNSGRRVAGVRERLSAAWRRAGRRHGAGVFLTLTSDPKTSGSIMESAGALLDDVERVKQWLAYEDAAGVRPGRRPPSIVVPEFTDSGIVHVHVALFGVASADSWLGDLRGFWRERCGRGHQVHAHELRHGRGGWEWVTPPSGGHASGVSGRSPAMYTAEGVNALAEVAGMDAEDVHRVACELREGDMGEGTTDDVDAVEGGRAAFVAALYWATGLPTCTVSPELRESREGGRASAPDGTPLPGDAPPRWRYVGTAAWGSFPAHIRAGCRRAPPPPEGT